MNCLTSHRLAETFIFFHGRGERFGATPNQNAEARSVRSQRVEILCADGDDGYFERVPLVSEHVFTSGVPSAGRETFQLLFYVVASEKSPLQKDAEVVIEKFEYLP
jgi:hypothetical protein